jgi:hypothetical protein
MQLKNFLIKLQQYTAIIKGLLIDSLLRFKGKSFAVLLSGFLGITFQVQAIGLSIYYAKAIEKGDTLALLGYEFAIRSSLPFLFLAGTGVLVSLLISAWMIYYSRFGILRLGRMYEEVCSTRLLSLFGSSLKVWSPSNQGFSSDSSILRLARTDARYCGRVFRLLLGAIVPFITLMVAIAALMYINTLLTLLIIFLMGVSAAFQYRVSLAGARNSVLMEEASGKASLEYRKIIQLYKESPAVTVSSEHLVNSIFKKGVVKQFFDAYEGRLNAVKKSMFVSDVLLAIAIFAILLSMGSSIIHEKAGWGGLIIYLVALRYMLVNLKEAVSRITSINRFFPQLNRYFQFLENTKSLTRFSGSGPEHYKTSVSSHPIHGSLHNWEIHKGSRIGLISSIELNRYTIAYLIESLLSYHHDDAKYALSTMWFVSCRQEVTSGDLRDVLGFPEAFSSQDFSEKMKCAGLWEECEKYLPSGLETPMSPELWEKIDPAVKFSLAILTASCRDCLWIMIDGKCLSSLPSPARDYFPTLLSDRIVVTVFNGDLTPVGTYGEEVFAVIGEDGISGIGSADWVRPAISDCMSQSAAAVSPGGIMTDSVDDELDDEI